MLLGADVVEIVEGQQRQLAAGVPKELIESPVEYLVVQQGSRVNGPHGARKRQNSIEFSIELRQDCVKSMRVYGVWQFVVRQ
jgi:hypothetical protein